MRYHPWQGDLTIPLAERFLHQIPFGEEVVLRKMFPDEAQLAWMEQFCRAAMENHIGNDHNWDLFITKDNTKIVKLRRK